MRDEVAGELKTAALWMRLVALLIDALIIVLVTLVLDLILFGTDTHERESLGLVMVVMAIYHIAFLTAKSATPGKTALGLSVTDRKGYALRPDTAILRYVVYFVGGSVLGVGSVVSIVLVIMDRERRRALHDRVAGTLVIAGRPRVPDEMNRYARM
jgi:uncharacterized RDD family membrane protein YckC